MKRILTVGLMMLGWIAGSALAQDNLAVNRLFSDHTVLQRDRPVPVWGTAKPGTKVAVKFGRQEKTVDTDKDGRWHVRLDALKASAEPAELTVKSATGDKPVIIADVLVGDVWFCSGQSNMEWEMKRFKTEEDVAKAEYPAIRHNRGGNGWTVCSPKTAGDFTATGFYFARRIHRETHVPIGLLNNAIGGTAIEPWIPPEGKLFTSHTLPLIPFAIKGMIWYQGESNGPEGGLYTHKMNALFTGLRKVWDQGDPSTGSGRDFPVYFVQLPNFSGQPNDLGAGEEAWAGLRLTQFKALKSIPNTGMAVTIDTSDNGDIHPNNKRDTGDRLAQWALVRDYGRKDLICSGPLYKGMKIEGAKVRILFDYVGKGLIIGKKHGEEPMQEVPSEKLGCFAIAIADPSKPKGLKWIWADAVIDGDTVVVSSPEIQNPVAVQYACITHPTGNKLYNKEGLPASPFRTDDGEE
ncbi:MAG: sialate O-acetylesterase [bacterium]